MLHPVLSKSPDPGDQNSKEGRNYVNPGHTLWSSLHDRQSDRPPGVPLHRPSVPSSDVPLLFFRSSPLWTGVGRVPCTQRL